MTATPSPNPTNLILLAALGIGVYWFMTRNGGGFGTATPIIYPTPAQNAQAYGNDTKALKYQLTAGLIGKAFDYFAKPGDTPYTLTTQNLQKTFGLGLQLDNVAYNPAGGASAFDDLYSLVR